MKLRWVLLGFAALGALGIGASPAAASSDVSLTVNSVSRAADTGYFKWDSTVNVNVSSTGYCPYGTQGGCSATLYAVYSDASRSALMSLGVTPSPQTTGAAPQTSAVRTLQFVGSSKVRAVAALVVIASTGTDPSAVVSDQIPVTDSLPPASANLTMNSVTRDPATGQLRWDVNASTSYYALTATTCSPYGCSLIVEAQTSTGVVQLGSTSLGLTGNGGSPLQYPVQVHLTGSKMVATAVSAVHVLVNLNGSVVATSVWVPVTDLVPSPTASISVNSIARDAASGQLRWDVGAATSYYAIGASTCSPYGCNLIVEAQTSTGVVQLGLTSIGLTGNGGAPLQYPVQVHLTGQTATRPISAIRARTGVNGTTVAASPWVTLHDPDKFEAIAGGNPAIKGCQCNAGDPVNTATGEFYETGADLGLPGVGPAVSVGRSYSTVNAAEAGPFGHGTTGNFNAALVVDTPGDSTDPLPRQLHIVQENGATVPFIEATDKSYPASPWVLATLTHDAATGNWTFTRDKKQVFVFNANGALISMSDLHGNTITYEYTAGQVTSITGSGGREVDLTWTSGRVSAVHDSAGRNVAYHYDGSGNLTQVDAADGGVWKYTYDSAHRILTETKPAGGVTTNVYNSTGQVTSQTDPAGRVTTFTYSGATTTVTLPGGSITTYTFNQGQPASITTATGTALASTITYAYDAASNVISETDPLGHATAYTYDAAGNALTTTDPLGKVTTRTFDSLRDVTSITDSLARTTSMTYNAAGDLTSLTTPGGHTSTWTLNTDGTVAASTDALNKTTSYSYDPAGRPLCVTDPDSRQTCQAYDSRGYVTSKTDPAGKITTLTYDNAGRVLTVTDPNSNTTTTAYDADGNLTSSQDASGHTVTAAYDGADQKTSSTDGRGKTTTYTYTSRGSLATVTDPNGHVTTNAYDALNRLTSTTDADNHVTTFGYDLAGHKTSTILPSTAMTSATYDADGRTITTTDALGKTTSYGYDDAGQLTATTDPLNRVTSFSYTDDGKPHVTTLPNASTQTNAYNANGAQTSFTNADGGVTSYTYDDAGLLSSKTEPGSMTTSYTYDTAGRIHTVTTPNGVISTRNYDDAGRLIGVDYPGTSDDVSYTYFADGARHTMTDASGTTTTSYDNAGNVTSTTNGAGATVGYGYDPADQMTSITYPGGKAVIYGYDAAGLMTSVTDWSNDTTNFVWTANGQLSTQADPNGVTENRTYDTAGQLTTIATTTGSTALASYGYGYDDAGEITSDSSTDPITTATHSYSHDLLNQLTTVTTGSATGSYTATPGGLLTGTPTGDTLAYNPAQELTARAPSTGPTTTYGYDANGSRSTATLAATSTAPAATTTFAYTAAGDLASVTLPGATAPSVTYTTDGDGLRQIRTDATSSVGFLWDTAGALPLLLDDGSHTYLYGPSSTPIAQIDDASHAVEYLHSDNVGSVRLVTDATGTVTATNEYDAFGNRNGHAGASDSQIGYTGNWTDPATGLIYLRARDYDPATAQFLTVDPLVDQTHQPYAYVANNPLNATDPTGLCGTMENDFTAGCNTFWGNWEKMINSDLTSPQANFLTQVLTTGVTGHIATTLEGIGDGASFGLTGLIRNAAGVDCYVQKDGFYYGGMVAGTVASTVASGGTASVAEGAGAATRGSSIVSRLADRFPGLADDTGTAGARYSADQDALIQLAKEAKRGGRLNLDDANTLSEWRKELGLKGHDPDVHTGPGYGGTTVHINVGRITHITVVP